MPLNDLPSRPPRWLAWVQWGAAAMVAAQVTLLALPLTSGASDAAARLLGAIVSTLLLAALWAVVWRLRAALAASDLVRQRQREILDALPAGIVLFDAQDRLELANADFCRLYPMPDALRAGASFESLLREAVRRGLVPDAAQHPGGQDAWIDARLAEHRRPGAPRVRRMPDGGWRRLLEQRLPDGSLLAHSIDVSDLVENESALQAARREAELASARLEDAIEASPAGFELYDADDRLLIVNRVMLTLYPRIADLATQRPTFEEVVRANHARGGIPQLTDAAALDAWIAGRQAERRGPLGGGIAARELRSPDGRWVRSHERRTREGGVVGIRIDITELVEQRAAAEQASAQLRDAIEALPDAFVLYDADDRIVLFNRRYAELYAASAPVMQPGTPFESVLRFGLAHGQYPQAAGREEDWLAERLAAHRDPRGPVLQQLSGDRWVRIDERRTRDGGIAGVRTEVTELVHREREARELSERLDALNAELARLSETDALTGLANRRRFDRALHEEFARAARHGAPLALLLLDVDHFKRFNDRHGHPAGDVVLQRVAAALRGTARRPGDLVARWGGEEFAVLLPHTGADEAAAHAGRCLAAVDAQALPHGDSPVSGCVTLTAGVATLDGAVAAGPADPAALVAAADAALYRAKQAGRHGVARADTLPPEA
jgi:diguanylate cyclase (GGDEF)-like protein